MPLITEHLWRKVRIVKEGQWGAPNYTEVYPIDLQTWSAHSVQTTLVLIVPCTLPFERAEIDCEQPPYGKTCENTRA